VGVEDARLDRIERALAGQVELAAVFSSVSAEELQAAPAARRFQREHINDVAPRRLPAAFPARIVGTRS